MCGISGVINASTSSVKELSAFIKDCILAGAVRGSDSVGIAAIDSSNDAVVYKDVLSPTSFVTAAPAIDLIDGADDAFFTLIHHRAATVGKVSVAGAQPFLYEGYGPDKQMYFEVIACHNGTLNSGYKLLEGKQRFASDSDWLAWKISQHLDENGIPDFDEALRGVTGAFSIVVTVAGVTYMLNNGSRPMHVAWDEAERVVMFASEPGMLGWLAARNGIKIKDNKIHKLAADVLYSFDYQTAANKISIASKKYTRLYTAYNTTATTGGVTATGNPTQGGTQSTTTGTTTSTVYRSTIEKLYEDLTGEPASAPATTAPVTNVVALPAAAPSLPTALTELLGKRVEFIFNDVDCNMGIAYGTYWIGDDIDIRDLSSETRAVISAATFLMRLPERGADMDADATYTAEVIGIRNISEYAKGERKMVPHLELEFKTLKHESSFVGNSASCPT
jgi:predicted glutamine amidotransferase